MSLPKSYCLLVYIPLMPSVFFVQLVQTYDGISCTIKNRLNWKNLNQDKFPGNM